MLLQVTFALWARCVRQDEDDAPYPSWLWAIPTGFAYFFMVSTWGGFVFMSNLIGIHAFLLWPLGHFTDNNYKAYSVFFLIGSLLSSTIPMVGLVHFKSMEMAAPLLVFLGYQYLKVMYTLKEKYHWSKPRFYAILYGVAVVGLALLVLLTFVIDMGGLSVRVRSLFLKHTHTGKSILLIKRRDSFTNICLTNIHFENLLQAILLSTLWRSTSPPTRASSTTTSRTESSSPPSA